MSQYVDKFKMSSGTYLLKDSEGRQLIEPLVEKFCIIEPSGDKNGDTDLKNINNALKKHFSVYLLDGTYYINNPIEMLIGRHLIGCGVTANTEIILVNNDTNCIVGKGNSYTYISIESIRFITNVSSTKPCINLEGNTTSPYNGATYSYFNNVFINNFKTAISCKGIWSTIFERIRTINCETGIYFGATCNNITVKECEFTHGTIGAKLSAYDGSNMLNNIRFDNVNFEGMNTCVDAIGVLGLSLIDCYGEDNEYIVKANSCPGFHMYGGTFINLLNIGNFENTAYPSSILTYKNPHYALENIYIRCNINENKQMLYASQKIKVSNVQINNEGSGNVTVGSAIWIEGNYIKDVFTFSQLEYHYLALNTSIGYENKISITNITVTLLENTNVTTSQPIIVIDTLSGNELGRASIPVRNWTKGQTMLINLNNAILNSNSVLGFILNGDIGTNNFKVLVEFNIAQV